MIPLSETLIIYSGYHKNQIYNCFIIHCTMVIHNLQIDYIEGTDLENLLYAFGQS